MRRYMLLIKRLVPFVQPKSCLFLSPEEKRPILCIGIKLLSLPVSWEYLYWGSLCSTSDSYRQPRVLALAAPLRVRGNRHPAVYQEARGFRLQVIWHFLVGVRPRVEPELTALICNWLMSFSKHKGKAARFSWIQLAGKSLKSKDNICGALHFQFHTQLHMNHGVQPSQSLSWLPEGFSSSPRSLLSQLSTAHRIQTQPLSRNPKNTAGMKYQTAGLNHTRLFLGSCDFWAYSLEMYFLFALLKKENNNKNQ